ncbi:myotubularin-related protein [Senna tora]|uniref:Myotubularin-related protein n=1 Tax=Senna tora TaxID=362788 RepID=A0A834WM61_9FABA|nr:myotubularin-related protein [Senna tora]
MPTQQVICRRGKTVVVRVYVEKPRKKSVPSNHHHHHHYRIHRTFRGEVVNDHGTAKKGYDRRAELLMYMQFLRNSARSTPLLSNQLSNNFNGKPTTRVVPSQKKPKYEGKHACFGNWELLIPSCLRSYTSMSDKPEEKKKKKQMHGGLSVNRITNVMGKN